MTSSNGSPPGPPPQVIQLCRWLWRVQKNFWTVVFSFVVAGIVQNMIVNILTASQAPGDLKQIFIVSWVTQHIVLMLFIAVLIAAIEFAIYFGSHVPLPATNRVASSPFPMPRQLLPSWWRKALGLGLSALLVVTAILWVGAALLHKAPIAPDKGIGIVPGSNALGICDGSCYFDTNRINGTLKQEAAHSASTGNLTDASAYWDWAAKEDTTDAEAKIYLTDTSILLNKTAHMTFVVAVPLTGNKTQIDESRDILQGAYVRQKEFNDAHPLGPQIYLLIANMGGQDSASQQTAASRILQAAHTDSTLVGVTGLPFGSNDLINTLSKNNIPMVSMAPLTNQTTKIPYLHSVAPTLTDEAQAAAEYTTNTLRARRVFVAFESGDVYSTTLEKAFTSALPNPLIGSRSYPGGSVSDLSDIAFNAVSDNADLIYFTGPPADASILLANLQRMNHPIRVMGGDIIYQSIHLPARDRANFNGLLFTAFAYPDEWSSQHMQQPPFIIDYQLAFDPDKQHAGNPYTYRRPGSDTILSYDALSLLIGASDNVLFKKKLALIPGTLWDALNQFTSSNQFQSVSGQVSFADASSAPENKAVLVLLIEKKGTKSLAVQSGTYSCTSSCYKEVSG